jgi:3-oxoacyl-[acyl-carrier-protein] synthase III
MTGNPEVHLSDFRVALGAVVPLDDLADADVVANLGALRESGATCAAVHEGRSVALAAELLRSADDPTGIVYATEDLVGTASSEVIRTLLRLSGRVRTPAFMVTGNGCANLGFALLGAASQCLATGPVTVVTSDKAQPGGRVLTDSMSVLGDAAGACTVTTGPPEEPSFQLVALRTTTQVASAERRPATMALRSMIDGVREATRAALDAAGWAATDVAGMLVGEYSTGARRFLAHASGISRQFIPRIPAGHCHSADIFRGLADLTESGALPDGTKVLVLASGRSSWSVFALRFRGWAVSDCSSPRSSLRPAEGRQTGRVRP